MNTFLNRLQCYHSYLIHSSTNSHLSSQFKVCHLLEFENSTEDVYLVRFSTRLICSSSSMSLNVLFQIYNLLVIIYIVLKLHNLDTSVICKERQSITIRLIDANHMINYRKMGSIMYLIFTQFNTTNLDLCAPLLTHLKRLIFIGSDFIIHPVH